MAAVLLVLGAASTVTGIALIDWHAAITAAGILALLAAVDLRR